MNRIFDLEPADESDVVDRILMQVHTAIDEHFPGVLGAPRQFSKTVFSQVGESTALLKAVPDMEKEGDSQLPPPPSKRKPKSEDDELFLPSEENSQQQKPQTVSSPYGVTKQPMTKSRGPEKFPSYQELQNPMRSNVPGAKPTATPQTNDLYSSVEFRRRLDLGSWIGLGVFVLALVLVVLVLFVF